MILNPLPSRKSVRKWQLIKRKDYYIIRGPGIKNVRVKLAQMEPKPKLDIRLITESQLTGRQYIATFEVINKGETSIIHDGRFKMSGLLFLKQTFIGFTAYGSTVYLVEGMSER